MGFPITPHQLVAHGPANAQERATPAVTLMLAGMPASPHQIAVLTPRQRPTEQIASSGERMGTARHVLFIRGYRVMQTSNPR